MRSDNCVPIAEGMNPPPWPLGLAEFSHLTDRWFIIEGIIFHLEEEKADLIRQYHEKNQSIQSKV